MRESERERGERGQGRGERREIEIEIESWTDINRESHNQGKDEKEIRDGVGGKGKIKQARDQDKRQNTRDEKCKVLRDLM